MSNKYHDVIVRMYSDCAPADTPHIKALVGSLVDIHTDTNKFLACHVESITEGEHWNEDFITVTTDYEMDNEVEGVAIQFKDINEIIYI